MKIKNKLLPIVGLACTASFIPSVCALSSCANEKIIAQGTWDVKNGGLDQYDENIKRPVIKKEDTPSKEGLDWREATDLYFNDVDRDYNIFINDVLYTVSHNMREFMYNFSYYATKQTKPIKDVFGMAVYMFKCTNVTVKLYKWDTVTHRISFDIDMKVESQNPEFNASGWCKFKWHNHPAALGHENRYALRDQVYPDEVGGWTLCPEAFAASWYGELWPIGEVVDPRYPMGNGFSHLIMTVYDDWYMEVEEHYDLPFGRRTNPDQTLDNHCVFNNAFLKKMSTSTCDDPEIFAQFKYWFTFHYINGIHYMDDVANSPTVY